MDEHPPFGISAAAWAATPFEVRIALSAVLPLLERVPVLEARVTALEAENADLRARLNQHSGNSSKPPSSDPPSVPPRPDRRRHGRARGAQPDHDGQTREPPPDDHITQIIRVRPATCPACATTLAHCPVDAVSPIRHHVWDLPMVHPIITEYQLQVVTCPGCATPVRAILPSGVPRGAFGASVAALIALLHTDYRLSLREIPRLLAQVFHLPIALGSTTHLYHEVGIAAAPVYHAVEAVVRQHDANLDETSWPQGRLRLWLWTMVTTVATLFRIGRRTRATFETLIGTPYPKIVTSDRFRAYLSHPLERRQLCWAHLRREFVAFYERDGPVGVWAAAALIQIDLMFLLWHGVRDGLVSHPAFQASMVSLQAAFHALLGRGKELPLEKARAFSRDLWNSRPALWTFVQVEGIEPTNNAAERALRPAVLWRKGCFGTQSADGSRAVERLLTIHATCRQQGHDPLVFLTEVISAYWAGRPAPSIFTRT